MVCIPYTEDPAKLDVDGDGKITANDSCFVWQNRDNIVPYNELYDMNCDGRVDFQDAGLVWTNRDADAVVEDFTTEECCTMFNGYWYNNSCHSQPAQTPQINWALVAGAAIGIGIIGYLILRKK